MQKEWIVAGVGVGAWAWGPGGVREVRMWLFGFERASGACPLRLGGLIERHQVEA